MNVYCLTHGFSYDTNLCDYDGDGCIYPQAGGGYYLPVTGLFWPPLTAT